MLTGSTILQRHGYSAEYKPGKGEYIATLVPGIDTKGFHVIIGQSQDESDSLAFFLSEVPKLLRLRED